MRWDVAGSASVSDDVKERFLDRYGNRISREGNVGTVLIQWAIALAVFLSLNRWLAANACCPG